MSQIYSSGNRATAIAAIIAAVNARISFDAAGVRVLNSQSLADWLRTELNLVATTDGTPPGGAAAVQKAVDAISTANLVQPLAQILSANHWSRRSDWPASANAFKGNKSGALLEAQRALRNAAATLRSQYTQTKEALLESVPSEYDVKVAPFLPEVITRRLENRAYIVTYVTDRGEESAPSPASTLLELDQNDTVQVTAPAPPSGRFITHFRVYRSSTTGTGAAYQYVPNDADAAGFPIATLAITDAKQQAELQETCPSLTWDEPPAALTGLIGMPNGMMLGFLGSRVLPAEAYTPYAYPVEYQQTLEYPFVAAGVFGQTAVILTTGNPYYAQGTDPASLSLQKLESTQACVSRRSVVSVEGGVMYASPDGLCLAGPGGVDIVTEGAYNRKEWQALNPADSFGAYHDGVYYLFLASGTCICIDLKSRNISTKPHTATAAYSDLLTDTLYVASGTSLLSLFSGPPLVGRWRSAPISNAEFPSYAWLRVQSEFESTVTIRLYGEGVLYHTATFNTRDPQRLPARRFRNIEVEVEATCPVTKILLATNSAELTQL